MFTWEVPSQRIKMATSPTPDVQRQPTSDENYHFTVLIRLPFPRGDFVDPPAVGDAKLPKLFLSDLTSVDRMGFGQGSSAVGCPV